MPTMLSPMPEAIGWAVADAHRPADRNPRGRMTLPAVVQLPSDDREAVDARLMQGVARGDQQAFAEIYKRFSPPLYATALRIVRDAAEAQDIVHDAFVAIWEKAASFDTTRGTAFSWVVTLVRNRAIDRVRMRRRRAGLLADSVLSDLGYDEAAPGAAADHSTLQGDDARNVRSAVAELPPEQQRALELAFFSGMTQEQIAKKLQAPLGTVKARIRRGLIKLRDLLANRS